jgi:hypothetical protein
MVVDGFDVWTYGDPPRRYKVLGVIPDERPGGGPYFAPVNRDVVEMARAAGGDAVMYVPSWSDLRGFYTSESLTIPINYIVIKYLD